MSPVSASPDAASSTRIRPADPRVVLLITVALIVASLVAARSSATMLGLLVFVSAWHLVTTGSAAATAASLRRTLPFAIVIVVLNAVFGPGRALVSLGGHRLVADRGFADGVRFALRLVVMLMSVGLLVAAVTPESLARGIYDMTRRVSRPLAERVALFVFLGMGFVPLLSDELDRIRMAQAFRGGHLHGGFRHRVDAARAWLVPLLVSAVHRSGQLAMVVELRHVRERLPRTSAPVRLRGADVALLVSTVAAIVAVSM